MKNTAMAAVRHMVEPKRIKAKCLSIVSGFGHGEYFHVNIENYDGQNKGKE